MSKFLQTPEFFETKLKEAQKLLGRHILVGVAFPQGVIFGKTFNPRFHKSLQWYWQPPTRPSIVMTVIGDYRDFGRIKSSSQQFIDFINSWVTGQSLTAIGLAKHVASFFSQYHEEPQCLAAHVVITNIKENEFFFIDFGGRIKRFSDFVVAGCAQYQETFKPEDLTEEETETLSASMEGGHLHFELPPSVAAKVAAKIHEVKKPATQFLKQEIAKKPYETRTLEDSAMLIESTLAQFDAPSESEQFELLLVDHTDDGILHVSRKTFERTEDAEQPSDQK